MTDTGRGTQPHSPDVDRRTFMATGTAGVAGLAAGAVGLTGVAKADAAASRSGTTDMKGKVAFVTGGARGIGRACAEEFAAAGADVVLYDIAGQIGDIPYPLATRDDLDAAKASVEKHGVRCLAIRGDVRDSRALKNAVKQSTDQLGGLDFMIANAGVTQAGNLETLADDENQAVIDINVGGVVKTIQAAMPVFRTQESGRAVVISSILGRVGNAEFPVYASTKWAVIGLAKSAALAMAGYGATCNVVCPTLVRTKLIDNEYALQIMSPQDPTYEALDGFLKQSNPIPIGSYEPRDIARIVMLFCGPDTAQITGEVFDVAAGANARSNA